MATKTPPTANPFVQAARSTVLAAVLLCASAAILCADEGRPASMIDVASHLHCRMYFGCLPDLSKDHGHIRQY